MKKIIAMAMLSLMITISIPALSFALTVDGVLYDKSMRCLIVTGGFGIYPGTSAPLSNDAGHTANLVGSSGTPIASFGYWYNSVIGIDRSKQVGAGAYLNGGFDGYVQKSTWQYNNSNTGTGYQGTLSSSYRGIDRSINQDLVTNPFKPAAPNLVWSFFLQKNYTSGSISGLESEDLAMAAMTITGSGLPNSTSYGSSGTFSKSGTTSLYETVSYGNYYVSFFIPNASKYNITYRVSHMRGDRNKALNNNTNYYNYAGSASFSSPSYYVESGGSLAVDVTVVKKSGTVIVDLYKGAGVTQPYENKTFYLYSDTGSFLKSAVTNTNGYVYFYSMPYATYSVRSSAPWPEHYYSPATQNVTLAGNSVTAKITLYRETGSLSLFYSTEDSLSKLNVRFKITNPLGSINYYYTDPNGQILLSNIITGTYIVEQMEAPIDYEKAATVTVTVSKSATTTMFVYNPILYDFSVDVIALANVSLNDIYSVTSYVTNKGGKAVSGAMVKIMYQGGLVFYNTYAIPAKSTIPITLSFLGSTLGNKAIRASINELSGKRENNMLDNIDTAIVNVNSTTNLQIEFIAPTMNYREGTDVISTFRVKNIGSAHMTPYSNLSVGLNISYTQLGVAKSIAVPSATSVIIPFGGDNLVFFKWKVPLGTAGIQIKLVAAIDPADSITETTEADNSVTIFRTITERKSSQTPDTVYEDKEPSWYINTAPPARISCNAYTWAVWEWESSWFARKSYALQLTSAALGIVPDINSPSRKIEYGIWMMGSGYGFTLDWNVGLQVLPGFLFPNSAAYTLPQTASIYFPEFMYTTANGKYQVLEMAAPNRFNLPLNPNSINNARLHFTPIWFSDGSYICQGLVEDIWTPAGMIYCNSNSNEIKISGSIYDDWYKK